MRDYLLITLNFFMTFKSLHNIQQISLKESSHKIHESKSLHSIHNTNNINVLYQYWLNFILLLARMMWKLCKFRNAYRCYTYFTERVSIFLRAIVLQTYSLTECFNSPTICIGSPTSLFYSTVGLSIR